MYVFQKLLQKLVPHQCLGGIWSRRDKNRSQEAATVLATVNQFNAVSLRVISTVLMDPNARPCLLYTSCRPLSCYEFNKANYLQAQQHLIVFPL